MISYEDPAMNEANPCSMAELLEVLEPMRIERERRLAIKNGEIPAGVSSPFLPKRLC
jgi:hypothetical protein